MGATLRIGLAALALGLALSGAGTPAGAAWQVLRTPLVRVYFTDGYEAAAISAAQLAEQALGELEGRLQHRLEGPLHLVLSDRTDLANGFTDVAYYNRVVIFPAFPVGMGYTTGLSPRMEHWLRLVITHELVHAVHLDMAEGPARGLRELFGHVPVLSTPNAIQPRSWLEGVATLEETRLVGGGRGEDPLFDMFLRADVLEDRLPTMDQTLGLYDLERFQPAGTVYLYGYAWFDFLRRRYGDQALLRLHKGYAGLRYTLPGEAVRDVVRQPAAQVWQQMQEELKSQFRRQIRAIEAQGATRPQGLASSGWVVVTPRVSPDGRWVAYAAQGPAVEDVRLLELATGRDRQLVLARATAPGGLDWTPDGRSVVYSSVERQGAREFADLFRVEVEGGRVRRLTRGLRAYAPAVSPDGTRVAFASREGLNTRLMVMGLEDPGGRPPRVVWQPPPGWQILSVAWRPGPYVAVSVWRPGGYTDILLLEPAPPPPDAAGQGSQAAASGAGAPQGQPWREVRWVTADRAVDERPSWSPDGKFLLFHSDRDGIYNLYAWEAGSGRFFRLTNVLTGAFDPVATPDGRSVVFSWYQASGYRLARLGWDQLRWEPVELRQDADAPGVAAAPAGASSGPAGPPGPGLPVGWKVEPYRPWETLRPQFWVPVSTDDWAGPQLGVQTGGQDVLGEHQYALEAAAGLLSGEPRLYAGYLFSAREGAGPYLLVEGLTRPVARGDGWWRLRQGRLAAAVSWGSNYRSYALQLAASSRDEEPLVDSLGHPLSAPAVRLQLVEGLVGRASLAGDHRAAWLSRAQLTVGTVRNYNGVFNPPLPWGYVLARSDLNRFGPGRPGWRLEVAAGLLGPDLAKAGLDDQGFAFDPGVPGPFQVRAFGRNELPAARAAAAAVRWEWAWRWRTLLRGMGDAPVFGRSVDGALFAEAVAGWNWDSSQRLTPPPWPGGQVASAVGLEVRLNLDLYYGGAPLSLRLGVARALSPYPVARIYFTIASR